MTDGRSCPRKCSSCLFGDICTETHVCEDYYPIDERMDEICLERMIKDDYEEFCKDWILYANQHSD